MTFARRGAVAFTVSLVAASLAVGSAAPAQAALCDPGFVYAIALDSSKVCVPLTDEVVKILTPNPNPTTTPSAAATTAAADPSSPGTPAQNAPKSDSLAPTTVYVSSDTGNAVTETDEQTYVDRVEKIQVSPSVVVPVTALLPDEAIKSTVKAKAPAVAPAPSATQSSTTPAPVTSAASAPQPRKTAPVSEATSAHTETGLEPVLITFGVLLAAFGTALIIWVVQSIQRARNPRRGRRRA